VIVVSREELNRGRYVVAVMITSAKFDVRATLPNCLPLRAGRFGLTKDCVAQAETIAPYELSDLDLASGPIGVLDAATLRDLIKAVGHVMDSDCEPGG
jgi:mRNA-degrading endonuclease toxin of MazEF toxin-antitoxin module